MEVSSAETSRTHWLSSIRGLHSTTTAPVTPWLPATFRNRSGYVGFDRIGSSAGGQGMPPGRFGSKRWICVSMTGKGSGAPDAAAA